MTPGTVAAIERVRLQVQDVIACGCGEAKAAVGLIDTSGLTIAFVVIFEHHDGPLMFMCPLPAAEPVETFDMTAATRLLVGDLPPADSRAVH